MIVVSFYAAAAKRVANCVTYYLTECERGEIRVRAIISFCFVYKQ